MGNVVGGSERFRTAQNQVALPSGIDGGGEPPNDGRMEARITRLESDVSKVREDVATLVERTRHMPNNAGLWKAVAVSAFGVITALWALSMFFAKPWLEHLIGSMKP